MISKIKDLTGNKYGRLTIISYFGKKNTKHLWTCKCDCGKIKNLNSGDLKNNKISEYKKLDCCCYYLIIYSPGFDLDQLKTG